ncbi:MAG TPA: hypothetical protein VHA56_02575 [Mucilaginibacter sp.]|nr:hypothetical protein [Mucilaginibacter sp.]
MPENLEESLELTLLIDCSDDQLVDSINEEFGAEKVSPSSNFIGGVSVAVFLTASLRTLRETTKNVLNFFAEKKGKYEGARIVYDGKKIDLKGYGPDDIDKILSLPAFEKLHK